MHKSNKALILPRLKALDIKPEDLTHAAPEPSVVDADGTPTAATKKVQLSQLIIDLSMMTLRVAHMKSLQRLKTVKDLCSKVCSEIGLLGLGSFGRVEIITDDYDDDHPLKEATRKGRGQGGTKIEFDLTAIFLQNYRSCC